MKSQTSKAAEQASGTCLLCGCRLTPAEAESHLNACPRRGTGKGRLIRLWIEGAQSCDHWLLVVATPTTTLARLDQLLRDTWLECCGHMSCFVIGRERYESTTEVYDWDERPRSMSARLGDVLRVRQTFSYRYDFGTPTHLSGKVLGHLDKAPARPSLQVVARNDPPDVRCARCGAEAVQICTLCSAGPLCGPCVERHVEAGEGKEAFLPVVNSPRMGVCGYCGPASDG